ncbi:MAG: hypothetical protein QOJ64_4575 [Acidobacteriota bacterium]|jgi:hypothetical protein|nr:hypothetical protein [Acidobacteriota bacterium]
MLLLLQGGAPDWTIIVSAAASVLSAVVALVATIIAARTYAQSRSDKKEEVEYKRPKFKLTRNLIELITRVGDEHSINPFFQITLTFENRNTHSANEVVLDSKILLGDKTLVHFVNRPVGEVEQGDTFEVTLDIPEAEVSNTVSYIRFLLTYCDGRTGGEYSQVIYRKFYSLPPDVDFEQQTLLELDRSEWEGYYDTHHNILKLRLAEEKEQLRQAKET